ANIVLTGEGRVIEVGPIRMPVKESGERTRGTLALVEFSAAGAFHSPPPHIHREHEEGFYVLDGELELTAGTQTIRAKPGTFVMVPIGVAHTFGNATSGAPRFLCTLSPGHYARSFHVVPPPFVARRAHP